MSNPEQPNKMWSGRFRELLNRAFEHWQRSLICGIALGAILTTTSTVASAATEPSAAPLTRCSQRTIDHLEAESDGIRDWLTLRVFYHRYRSCGVDGAEVTEGASESVARMLADHWDTLANASRLFKQDPALEAFALARINITDSTDDLNRIDKLAAKHRPADLHALCQKLRDSIRNNN